MLYSEQLRAARALLRWEQSTVAIRAGISVETVNGSSGSMARSWL